MDRQNTGGKRSTQTTQASSAVVPQVLIALGPKDKENLSSPDVILKCKQPVDKSVKKGKTFLSNRVNNNNSSNKFQKKRGNVDMIKNAINNINETTKPPKQVLADDLKTGGKPSEGYWEQLSESRRVALDATLKENAELHSRVMELEYENTRLKSLLAEAKNTIKVLTELVYDSGADDEVDSARGDSFALSSDHPNDSTDEDDADASGADVSFASIN